MLRHDRATILTLALCAVLASACVQGTDELDESDTPAAVDAAEVTQPPDADPDGGPPDAGPDEGPPDASPDEGPPPDTIAPPVSCTEPIFNPPGALEFDLNTSGLVPGDSLSQAEGFQSSPFELVAGPGGVTAVEFTSAGQNTSTQFDLELGPKVGVLVTFSYDVRVANGGTLVVGVTNNADNEGGSMQINERLDATDFNAADPDFFTILDPLSEEGTLAFHLGPQGASWCVDGEVYHQPMSTMMAVLDRINFVVLGDPTFNGGPIDVLVYDLRIHVLGPP